MRLITTGRPRVTSDSGAEVALQPLALALLTYLVVGGPRDRRHLAELFWSDSQRGLNSLSSTLSRIRADVPGAVWIRGYSLVGSDLASDIGDLREAIDESNFAAVAQLCGGPFLENLRLRRPSAEFDEWVLEERATLASMAELTLLQHGRTLFDAGEHDAAADAVEQAWEAAMRDGFPSPDYFQTYHRILAFAARPIAAAVRTAAEEFGVELPPQGPLAFSSERYAHKSGSTASPPTPTHTDHAGTQLFGYRDELNEIAMSVASQQLTTIVGLGGSGKTRLAAEFLNSVRTAQDFPHRYWVNLQDVTAADLVGPAIAAEVGQRFDDVASLAAQLPNDEPVLLVLDNFEQVLNAAGIVKELVGANRGIRFLVTSRLPLEMAAESLVWLNGLDILDDDAVSPAEQLFVASARRVGASADGLASASQAAIRNVCRRVGGNPLALEIAGGWMKILSPTEILDGLSVNDELLGSPLVGDRSMEAVLNQSWSNLDDGDQKTLMLLATFRGGCPTKEILKLREFSIRSIVRLVQRSLVRQGVEGRITLHPLIAGHALAELEQRPDLQEEFHQVLSNWCQSYAAAIQSGASPSGSQVFEAEIANFASAWSWDARHQRWDLHHATLIVIRRLFNESGRLSEGRALFAMAVEALRSDPDHSVNLLAACLEALGYYELQASEPIRARSRLEEALALCPGDDPHVRSRILRSLGLFLLVVGEPDEALSHFNEGLALVEDEPGGVAATHYAQISQTYSARGEREQATKVARLGLEAARLANDSSGLVLSYLVLGDLQAKSDPHRAIAVLNEGWEIAKEESLDNVAFYFPLYLGWAYLELGEGALAETYFTDGIQQANEAGQLMTEGGNYVGRAEARLLRGAIADAVEDLTSALRLALKVRSGPVVMWAAVGSCDVSVARDGPSPQAKELLLLTLRHPAAHQDVRDKAIEILRDAFDEQGQLEAEPVSSTDEADLDEIAERALELLTQT